MRRLIVALAVPAILLAVSADAAAISIEDVIELSRARLSDDVIVELIDIDGTVHRLDTATIVRLKDAGVSERVIVALMRNGRRPAPGDAAAQGVEAASSTTQSVAPMVVIIDRPRQAAPVVRPPAVIPVPYAVYVPYGVGRRRHYRAGDVPAVVTGPGQPSGFGRFINDGFRPETPPPASEPVYWGWDGKLRPGAWLPAK
jgi:hypothetical protein